MPGPFCGRWFGAKKPVECRCEPPLHGGDYTGGASRRLSLLDKPPALCVTKAAGNCLGGIEGRR
jgi:hypothetical protein